MAIGLLAAIVLGCVFCEAVMNHDPTYMDLANRAAPPGSQFYFGTDMMGRDVFSMIWYGGRISLFIGLAATALSTLIAVVYGSISGLSNEWIDDGMMRLTEIILSIPSILIVIFIQAIIGQTGPLTIAFVIGITSWMNISKIVRSEVRQIRNADYILAAKTMDGGFFYILRWHLLPNFVSSIMFMVVTNIGAAIGTEATLSFLGIGLPVEIISWGSMLSNADQALLSNDWWIILIPGLFLVVTLVCITDIGNYIRKRNNRGMREI
nr:ABC transporter permease [Eubacterium sp. 1001713B170207_170306_E7]